MSTTTLPQTPSRRPDTSATRRAATNPPVKPLKLQGVFAKPSHGKKNMNDYVSLLLETDAAKRKLAQLFQSEEPGRATPPSTGIVTRDSSCAVRTDIEQNSKTLRESRREHGLVRARTRTAIPTIESGQVKRDLTVSSFVFTLV
jgi:hypothetical protein